MRSSSSGSPGGATTDWGWPARYALRRFTWRAQDRIWEMKDRRP